MKHTFWYIDRLMELIGDILIPQRLDNPNKLHLAREVVDKIKEYDFKLRKLIDNHRAQEHLRKLHESHIDILPDWAERVNRLFEKLDEFLRVLESDIPKLENCVRNEPEKWADLISDMSFGMIQAGFHYGETEMEEFRRTAIFEERHLREILGDLEDIEELLE